MKELSYEELVTQFSETVRALLCVNWIRDPELTESLLKHRDELQAEIRLRKL